MKSIYLKCDIITCNNMESPVINYSNGQVIKQLIYTYLGLEFSIKFTVI